MSHASLRKLSGRLKNASGRLIQRCVLHAVAKFVPPAATLLDAGGSLKAARAKVVSNYQDLVDGVARRLQAKGIAAEPIVKDGEPGKVIVKEAKEWGPISSLWDLMVMVQ